jgi:hypothetical protein
MQHGARTADSASLRGNDMNEISVMTRRHAETISTWARRRFLGLWQGKGGGVYGLGYALTFVALELRAFGGEIAASDSAAGFIAGQMFGYLIRISVDSLLNALYALVWPLVLLNSLGVWLACALTGAFLIIAYAGRQRLEAWFPEVREVRLAKRQAKR